MKAQWLYTLYIELYEGLDFSQLQENFIKEVNEMAEGKKKDSFASKKNPCYLYIRTRNVFSKNYISVHYLNLYYNLR